MVAWFVPVLIQQFYFVSRALCYGILSKSSPDTLWWGIEKYDILDTDHKPWILAYYLIYCRQDWQSDVNPLHLSGHLAPKQADTSASATTDSESNSASHLAPKQADRSASASTDSESDIPSPIQLFDSANHSAMSMYTPSSRKLW